MSMNRQELKLVSGNSNKNFESKYLSGKITLELVPQGTLAERIRAHAAGIPGFYTPTGASTAVEEGTIPQRYNEGGAVNGIALAGIPKEGREINGKRYILETALPGDVAFVRAWKVDEVGNCVFRCVPFQLTTGTVFNAISSYASQNFNTVMAKSAKLTIVEVNFGINTLPETN